MSMFVHQLNRGFNVGLFPLGLYRVTVYKSFTGIAATDSDHGRPDFSTSLERTKFGALRNQVNYVIAKITLLN